MHFKETVSILSLEYELNQIKNGKMFKFCYCCSFFPLALWVKLHPLHSR